MGGASRLATSRAAVAAAEAEAARQQAALAQLHSSIHEEAAREG